MAARDPDGWRYKRSALGFLSDRTLDRDEQAQARSMKCALIDQMRAVGDEAEAARLELPGAEGHPNIDNMQVLANMLSIRIELHSFSFELPVMTFGDGAVVRIGHMQLLSDTGSSSGHFVALRTVDNVEGYCMAPADGTSQTLVLGPSSNSFLSGSRSEEKISTNYSDEELPPIDANDNAQDNTSESSTSTTSSSYSCSTNTSSSSTSVSFAGRDRTLEDMLKDIIGRTVEHDQDVPAVSHCSLQQHRTNKDSLESDSPKDLVFVSASGVVMCGQVPPPVPHPRSMKPLAKDRRFCEGSLGEACYFVLANGLPQRCNNHECCCLCTNSASNENGHRAK